GSAPPQARPASHSKIRLAASQAARLPQQTASPRRHQTSSPLQDLREQDLQRRSDAREPLLDDGLANPLARDRLGPPARQMIEHGDDLLQLELTFRSPLDDLEQRAQLLFRRHQRPEARPEKQLLTRDLDTRLTSIDIRWPHSATT